MTDIWQLARPRLVMMVLFSTAATAWSVAVVGPRWQTLAVVLLGTGLVIAGSIVLNQLLERDVDARMARTAARPLPARRLSLRCAAWWGLGTTAMGLGCLALAAPPAVFCMAAISWVIYVCLYTPLKRRTVWHTAVGAVAGAMPVLIGAATVGAGLEPVALLLFAAAYLWQFPHTMAIGHLYCNEYRAAGIRTAPVVDPSGRLAGRVAVGGASGLLGVSLLLPQVGPAGWGFAAFAAVLGLTYLTCAHRFAARYDLAAARALLLVSLAYLPALLIGHLIAVRI